MLVYIRKSSFQRLLFPVAYSDIPQQVHDRFENERRHEEEIKKDAAEAHIFVLIKVAVVRPPPGPGAYLKGMGAYEGNAGCTAAAGDCESGWGAVTGGWKCGWGLMLGFGMPLG